MIGKMLRFYCPIVSMFAVIPFLGACGEPSYSANVTCVNGKMQACGQVTKPQGTIVGAACYDLNPLSKDFKTGGYAAAGNYGSIVGSTIGDFNGNNQTAVTCNGEVCKTTVKTKCADGKFKDVEVTCTGQTDTFGAGMICNPTDQKYSGSIYFGGMTAGGGAGSIFGNITSEPGCTTGGGGCKLNWGGSNSFGIGGKCGDGSYGATLFLEFCK